MTTGAESTDLLSTSNLELAAVLAEVARPAVARFRQSPQGFFQPLPLVLDEPQTSEEYRLESTYRVNRGQKVVAQLWRLDDRSVSIGNVTEASYGVRRSEKYLV